MNKMVITSVVGAVAAVVGLGVFGYKKYKNKTTAIPEGVGYEFPMKVAFDAFYCIVPVEIPYEESFGNGKDYFDPMTRMDFRKNGLVKTIDRSGRRIIMIGGGNNKNAVIFQRFTDSNDVYVMQLHGKCIYMTSEDINTVIAADEDKYYDTAVSLLNQSV